MNFWRSVIGKNHECPQIHENFIRANWSSCCKQAFTLIEDNPAGSMSVMAMLRQLTKTVSGKKREDGLWTLPSKEASRFKGSPVWIQVLCGFGCRDLVHG
jgi:hypothetical protein